MKVGARCPSRSVMIEDKDGTVFEGDVNRLGGLNALLEQVEGWFPFVGWNPFADGLPWWLEGLDVERRLGRWRDVDDAFPAGVNSCGQMWVVGMFMRSFRHRELFAGRLNIAKQVFRKGRSGK